jgi:hypothetical protein
MRRFQNLPPNVLRKIMKNHVYAEVSPREVARLRTVSKDFRNSGVGYYGSSKQEWANAIKIVRNALNSPLNQGNTAKERDALEVIKRMRGDIPAMKSKSGQTVLMMAARQGDVHAAEMLLRRGVIDIEAKDNRPSVPGGGATALMHAIRSHAPDNDTTKMVDLLLRWKANPNATFFGMTALQSAVSRTGSLPIVKNLLRHGADVRVVTRNNLNLLMLAVLHGHYGLVNFFLKKRFFNVNATASYDMTALLIGLSTPRDNILEIVKLLVRHGAVIPAEGYNNIRRRYGDDTVTEIRNMRNRVARQTKSLFRGGAKLQPWLRRSRAM